MDIENIRTRQQSIDFLDGYAQLRKDELYSRKLTKGLVKSYLLETVPDSDKEPDIDLLFKDSGFPLKQIDDYLYKIWDMKKGIFFGFLEKIISRHPVIYTTEDTKDSDPWIKRLINANYQLDRLWISGWTFGKLWDKVLEINSGKRYGRLVFEYQSIFDIDSDELEDDEDLEHFEKSELIDNLSELYTERKASRFTVVERLEDTKRILPKLQESYSPLRVISQLRFPSVGKGGHDFYHDGKVTNRSDNFIDHRAHLMYVLKIYKGTTEDIEQKAWCSMEKNTLKLNGEFVTLRGVPVVMKFKEPLSTPTFENWINSTFQKKRNKFRLWGNPIYLGSNKIHVYGADRHLWQPIFLEITNKHVIAILPKGTCGNTIHRLITNIQRYIDPEVDVWIGDQNYRDLITESINKRKIKYTS